MFLKEQVKFPNYRTNKLYQISHKINYIYFILKRINNNFLDNLYYVKVKSQLAGLQANYS